jgi:hypothetical protein
MGRAKYIYFSDEVISQLEGIDNMSKLVNELLIDYFKDKNFEDLNKDEIALQLEKLDLEEEHIKKMKEWEEKWNKRNKK